MSDRDNSISREPSVRDTEPSEESLTLSEAGTPTQGDPGQTQGEQSQFAEANRSSSGGVSESSATEETDEEEKE